MKLLLGVTDVPYNERKLEPARVPSRSGRRRRPRRGLSTGTQTTGDIAEILERRYHIVETFVGRHDSEIIGAVENSLLGNIENQLMGGPALADPLAAATSEIEHMFRGFLDREEMAGMPGIPTAAALRGVNHRLARPNARGNPRRPSFIDSGLYQASFRVWSD